jgi:hypothetical protein
MQKNTSNTFLKFGAGCACLSALTTLGVHWLFDVPTKFDEQVLLYENTRYLFRCVWVIVHCLLVMLSMIAFSVAYREQREIHGWLLSGLIGFLVFGIAEVLRMTLTLTYLNALREKYVHAADVALQALLKVQIESWSGINTSLFLIFIVAFSLGNLFYGVALWRTTGFEKTLSSLLLMWGILNLTGFANRFMGAEWISSLTEFSAVTFQPAMRLAIAWHLWKKSDTEN